MTPRVWFKSISLENVHSFGTKQTIDFTDKDGNAAQWNVILGDNGTGKTTVLRSLFLLVQDYYFIFDNQGFKDLLRSNRDKAIVEGNVEYVGSLVDENITDVGFFINRVSDGKRWSTVSAFDYLNDYQLRLPINAYGAARRVGDSAITESNSELALNMFDGNVNLVNPEEWLVQAEYLSLKDNKNYKDRFETVKELLLNLFAGEIVDINTHIVKVRNGETPKVIFKTHYGDVFLHDLNLGYKTLIAWMTDFAKGLLDRYPDSKNPLSEPAICLVDEIDLHLHPKFQRTIIQFLTETFPNTQFIVTAHSPLIVQSAGDANIILLKRVGDEVHVENDPVDVRNWRLDQILSSELFGIEDKTLQMRRERDKLLGKNALSEQEQNRLLKLNAELDSVPFSSDPAEMKAETIIHQLAEALRDRM